MSGPRHRCTVRTPEGCTLTVMVKPGEPLLTAAARQVPAPLSVGCRRGGCGVCRIRILSGTYEHGRPSRRHVSLEEAGEGFALACQVIPTSDLELHASKRTATAMSVAS